MKTNFSTILHRQKGQSLLEIAVSLGLVALIITILTITTLNGLRNSQFAKNQVLASSYAQQGIELIKVMRQRDCQITVTSTTDIYKWYTTTGTQKLIWTTTDEPFRLNNGNFFIANTGSTCSLAQGNLGESLENNVFNRRTRIERLSDGVLRVTVIVSWNDFSGAHEATNVSLITNYENI